MFSLTIKTNKRNRYLDNCDNRQVSTSLKGTYTSTSFVPVNAAFSGIPNVKQ